MMTIKCPTCGIAMHKIEIPGNKQHFLCTIDTSVVPPNIDLGTGMPVDAYGCVKCGSISLKSEKIIGEQPRY